MSLSSYNSRTTHGSHRQEPRPGIVTSNSTPRFPQDSMASRTALNSTVRRSRTEQSQQPDRDSTVRASSANRFSRMLGSVTGRTPRTSEQPTTTPTLGRTRSEAGSIYNASVVSDGRKDSAEELRKEMLRQEEAAWSGGLENVRACCDGMSSLSIHPLVLDHCSNTDFLLQANTTFLP